MSDDVAKGSRGQKGTGKVGRGDKLPPTKMGRNPHRLSPLPSKPPTWAVQGVRRRSWPPSSAAKRALGPDLGNWRRRLGRNSSPSGPAAAPGHPVTQGTHDDMCQLRQGLMPCTDLEA